MIVEAMESVQTRTQRVWLGEDDILYAKCLPVENHTLEDAFENHNVNRRLCGNMKLPMLTDLRSIGNMSREARIFYASEDNAEIVLAMALLVDNAFSKMMGNFFIRLNKPRFPTKMFTSENAAITWLQGFH